MVEQPEESQATANPKVTLRALRLGGAHPVRPPPGCVPAPHRYSPETGARYREAPGTGRMKSSWSSVISPW